MTGTKNILSVKNSLYMKNTLFAIIAILFLASCTDSQQAKMGGYGNKYKVEVLSGGQIIRTYTSTGKVLSEDGSDGYYFMGAATGKLVEVSGDVIISRLD